MSTLCNIVDEAKEKIKTERLNSANLVSYFINSDDNSKAYEIMESPIFSRYSKILERNIKERKYEPIFKYKPEYASYYVYGTSSYDYLILHANGMKSKKEFKQDNFLNGMIKYYSKDVIKTLESEFDTYTKNQTKEIIIENYLLYNI